MPHAPLGLAVPIWIYYYYKDNEEIIAEQIRQIQIVILIEIHFYFNKNKTRTFMWFKIYFYQY